MASGASKHPLECVRVGFYLTPEFPLLAFAAALDPLRQANRLSETPLYEWVLISQDGSPVENSAGFAVPIDNSIENAPRCQVVIVCCGADPARNFNNRVLTWLRRLNRQGVLLGGISTGAYLLARTGLLDGRSCTVHWENFADFQEMFPNVLATNDIFTVDGSFITSSGGTVTLDMMLSIIVSFHGRSLAVAISDQFNHPQIRGQGEAQRMTPEARYGITHTKLCDVVRLMQSSVHAPINLAVLAKRVGLSSRQVERLFLSHLDRTPIDFYSELRMERAHELICRTSLPVDVVAQHCGYSSAPHFARRYRLHFGVSPAAERNARSAKSAEVSQVSHLADDLVLQNGSQTAPSEGIYNAPTYGTKPDNRAAYSAGGVRHFSDPNGGTSADHGRGRVGEQT
ncbi:GlxA family transcriptional regulator [Ensifer adhaerens]|nr:GlxA family transcriptional regulator [Ensifer adhaerens]UAY05061.1 GlxA family transcriptional regulator [Ensifer adhaerens]UAY12481.1 GlxA family transcriptional regulator [Ensifer adhaerens]